MPRFDVVRASAPPRAPGAAAEGGADTRAEGHGEGHGGGGAGPPGDEECVADGGTDQPCAAPVDAPAYGQGRSAYALALITMLYLHASMTCFVVPALLPSVATDLTLSDNQAAVLTLVFTAGYSLALIPAGWLADSVDRMKFLAAGCVTLTIATAASSAAPEFGTLVASRALYALGNAAQNPVAFSVIPELFPRKRSFALSLYNLAIHAGRGLSFACGLLLAGGAMHAGADKVVKDTAEVVQQTVTISMDALTDVAMLGGYTILYTVGDQIILSQGSFPSTPEVTGFINTALEAQGIGWRDIFFWVGAPGFLLALLVFSTLPDPGRCRNQGSRAMRRVQRRRTRGGTVIVSKKKYEQSTRKISGLIDSTRRVLSCGPFRSVTTAALLNDFAGWSLIAWQAAFYERTYEVDAAVYAPALAVILPVGGVIGGLGGGWLADRFPERRRLLLVGSSVLAAPVLMASLLAPSYQLSLALLLPAFALSEVFRAPTAILTRDVAPSGLPSAATATHLAVRNLFGGLGPLAVSFAAQALFSPDDPLALQHALLLAPACYALAGLAFLKAEAEAAEPKESSAAA